MLGFAALNPAYDIQSSLRVSIPLSVFSMVPAFSGISVNERRYSPPLAEPGASPITSVPSGGVNRNRAASIGTLRSM